MIKKIIGILLLIILQFNNSFAKDDLELSVKELLKERDVFDFADSDIEIEIYNHKSIPYSEITKIDLSYVDKKNKSFNGAVNYIHKNKKLKKNISGKYSEFLHLPVLNKVFKKGKIIQEEDIELIRVNVSGCKKNILTNKEDILEKTPRSLIMPKKIITLMEIIEPIAVEKNKIIDLSYYNNQISIKMPVQALQSGSIGEMIKVKNLKSNVILNALIEGESSVTINSTGR